jgi:hypothetical protein
MAHVANETVVSTAKHDIPHMETSHGIGHLLLLSLSAPVCGCYSASAPLLLLLLLLLFSFDSGFLFLFFPLRTLDPFFCGWQNGRFKLFKLL